MYKNDMNEDAITSMVFTPLRFMKPDQALNCLELILTRQLANLRRSRSISSFSLKFWPEGLRSNSRRCEPDLVARLEFTEGPSLMIIGEMKWDSYPSKAELEAQIVRERNAIKEHNPKADILMFALVKSKKRYLQGDWFDRAGCPVFEWTEFHQLLNRYLSNSPAQDSAQRRWAHSGCRGGKRFRDKKRYASDLNDALRTRRSALILRGTRLLSAGFPLRQKPRACVGGTTCKIFSSGRGRGIVLRREQRSAVCLVERRPADQSNPRCAICRARI